MIALNVIDAQARASTTDCLDVDGTSSRTHMGEWDWMVHMVDPDPNMALPPYQMPNATLERLAEELAKWSILHSKDGKPVPVYFRNVEPQVVAQFRRLIG